MRRWRHAMAALAMSGLLLGLAPAVAPPRADADTQTGAKLPTRHWVLSNGSTRVGKDRAIGLKLDDHRVMWVGGLADDPVDNNAAFIYDIRTRTFRETAPIPAAKPMDVLSAAGVLADGTVVVVGGDVVEPASQLSYRYDPRSDRWTRTGDLPEAQEWAYMPMTLLRDGRLVIAGGVGLDGVATGTASRMAFVYDVSKRAAIDVLDPVTARTGARAVVQGKWDYTRRANGTVSTLSTGHSFGNAALLNDGRLLVAGGHSLWDFTNSDTSVLATNTDFFNPSTGVWSQGTPLPSVPGEDDRISNSHGGRTNGVGLAVLPNGKVVIVGGYSAVDGDSFFGTWIGRQSIMTMTPAADPMKSRYRLSQMIPEGTDSGGLFGDGGRGQVLAYPISQGRVVIAGGQDTYGEDLYDSYVYDDSTSSITRGPDMVHGIPVWVTQHPEWGYPDDYQTAAISSRGVSMYNSRLVFDDDVLVHGGAYDGIGGDDFLGSRYVEQLIAE